MEVDGRGVSYEEFHSSNQLLSSLVMAVVMFVGKMLTGGVVGVYASSVVSRSCGGWSSRV